MHRGSCVDLTDDSFSTAVDFPERTGMRELSNSCIASMFPDVAHVHCVTLVGGSGREYMLYPRERASIAAATPARQQEFARGRHAARIALSQAGLDAGEIPVVSETGAPEWPAGVIGSISHVDVHVAAVVARESEACVGLGIDLVHVNRDPLEVASQFMSHEELAVTHAQKNASEWACVVLACKEASFKAISRLMRETIPRLEDIRITMDPGRRTFRLVTPVAPEHPNMAASGCWAIHDDWVISTAIVSRR